MVRHIQQVDMEKLVSLCKRRGFMFQGSEIYGGIGSIWDYGPLGSELKRNVRDAWWRAVVWQRDDIVGLDAAIIMNPQTWVASGHAEGFTDPLVECKICNQRFREDQLDTPQCPDCAGELTEPRMFNLMFKTFVGPVEDSANQVWLRPETAQGIFVNFDNVLTTSRFKLPFGIAQVGKAFRNEITPGNFVFRTREFEQMEIEYFVKPGTDEEWHQHWLDERMRWYTNLGIRPDNLRLRRHESDELAHYAKDTYDIEYHFPWGWGELEGIANRADFDLSHHAHFSGRSLDYYDEESKERVVPYVIEPSGGVDRALLAFLVDAYDEEPDPGSREMRSILRLHPSLAPIKIAVLPLSRNERLVPTARQVYQTLRQVGRWNVDYDDAQSIGRRYRRHDEIGTPYCITVDFKTVEEDQAVTIRERDSMEQVRIPIERLVSMMRERLEG